MTHPEIKELKILANKNSQAIQDLRRTYDVYMATDRQNTKHIKKQLEAISDHLKDTSSSIAHNTKFRYEAKVWFAIVSFAAVSLSGVLNAVLINYLT